jgi:cellulose synthase/poly-beta-1,6-N-acetylglucosamine synthase-like glycosyltransferase
MGWRFVYLADDDVPAELPVEINAFKSQQRRWAKGVVQVGIKLFRRMWRDPRYPLASSWNSFFRLTGNLAAPLVIVLALINLPILIIRYNQGLFHLFALDVPILTFSHALGRGLLCCYPAVSASGKLEEIAQIYALCDEHGYRSYLLECACGDRSSARD